MAQVDSPKTNLEKVKPEVLAAIRASMTTFKNLPHARGTWKIMSFFEELPIPDEPTHFGPLVGYVDTYLYGQPQFGLHTDHRRICFCSDTQDQRYKVIESALNGMLLQTLNVVVKPYQKQDYIFNIEVDALNSLDNTREHYMVPLIREDRFSWVFQDSSFRSWLGKPRSMLWIKGKPGSGKTTLMTHLLHNLPKHYDITTCFFSFGPIYSTQASFKSMLKSLLLQLLLKVPSHFTSELSLAFSDRSEYFGTYGRNWEWGEKELKNQFLLFLRQASDLKRPLFILVDALDECSDGDQREVYIFINDVLSDHKAHVGVTSRLESQCAPSQFQQRIRLEDHNLVDIRYYVMRQLDLFQPSSTLGDKMIIVQKISQMANGNFLWCRLVMSNFDMFIQAGAKDGNLEDICSNIPLDVTRLYESIISRKIFGHRHLLLRWVTFAMRPLTVTELQDALLIGDSRSEGEEANDSKNMETSIYNPHDEVSHLLKEISSISGGILEISMPSRYVPLQPEVDWTSPVVTFIHQSVKEYLLGDFWSIGDSHYRNSHKILAKSCGQYLTTSTPDPKIRRPFFNYCLCYGRQHAEIAQYQNEYSWRISFAFNKGETLESWIISFNHNTQLNVFSPGATTINHILAYLNVPVLQAKELNKWKHCDVNSQDHLGLTPLALAAALGHKGPFKQLLQLGADWGIRDNVYGQTPLGWASAYGHVDIVKLLIGAGADINESKSGTTPLHLAIRNSHVDVVQRLLDHGASVHLREKAFGRSALGLAATLGRGSMVNLLTQYGGSALEVQDKSGWTVLHCAIASSHRITSRLLLDTISKTDLKKIGQFGIATEPAWVGTILSALSRNILCCGPESQPPSSTSAKESTQESSRPNDFPQRNQKKRGRDESADKPGGEEDGDLTSATRKLPRLNFACPYYKRYPDKFTKGACVGSGFPAMHRLMYGAYIKETLP
ncbi:unnamed protein product [Clonostachys byssicola]|uniref:Nephrocystin 3-like N-terminal domain-containing protein n=1 Tax=Clonostachys byssicola TaxID=160290 RepID=A0A9N9UVJ2_9HYPO|nr:unnamed protein product [Clonostachys byssicola]